MSLPGETALLRWYGRRCCVCWYPTAQPLAPLGTASWGALLPRVSVLGASALQLNSPLSSGAQAPDSVFNASAHLRCLFGTAAVAQVMGQQLGAGLGRWGTLNAHLLSTMF